MQSMCILFDDQICGMEDMWSCIVINWLNFCGYEWCECQIYVNGINITIGVKAVIILKFIVEPYVNAMVWALYAIDVDDTLWTMCGT